MTHPREPEPLRPMLKTAESHLVERMQEACAHDVLSESTAELMRLEETLTDAAQAAKQAVSLRRRLRTGHGAHNPAESVDDDEPGEATGHKRPGERRATALEDRAQHADDESAVREFLDGEGVRWRVWAVTQEQLHPERLTADQLGDYRGGWLAFERTDGTERRRYPHYPPNWRRMSNLDLEGLLERAEAARPRRPSSEDSESTLA